MRAIAIAAYLFLSAPIALVVLFSFNAGRSASEFTGFSVMSEAEVKQLRQKAEEHSLIPPQKKGLQK